MRKKLRKQSFTDILQNSVLKNFIKKRFQHGYFPVKFEKFLRTSFFYRTPPVATSETKYIHASAADLLHIRIANLDWCKCVNCKYEAREIDCLFCREVDAMLIASAKIPERE